MRIIFFILIATIYSLTVGAQNYSYPSDNPIELGKVNWLRNYDEAITMAEKLKKPIFILFQEVPGCGNCTKYGRDILSHPLIIEAIEDNFVPLAIYNNKGGHDKEILNHFDEPAWNNPVVRFVSMDGISIGSRIANFKSTSLLLDAIIDALKSNKSDITHYIEVLRDEYQAKENGVEEVYLSMYCFWTGEKEIAQITGVVSTEAGFMHGKEVVKVKYDGSRTKAEKIAVTANKVKCADQIFSNANIDSKIPSKKMSKYRKDGQHKYYLQHSGYRKIPMTEYQKTLVNSALGRGDNPKIYLSPRQMSILHSHISADNFIDKEFVKSWYSLIRV